MFGATNAAFHNVVRFEGLLHPNLKMRAHPACTEVIRERQSALPVGGSDGAVHVF